VLGAGGGVGLAAVQLGGLLGASVTAVASSKEKLDAAASYGARNLIDHRSVDLRHALRALVAGSGLMASHADCDRIQDPYSLRCVPQVHGASRDAARHATGVVEIEINSVTDNPLVFPNGDIVSGGNFHGQPLALVLDQLAVAAAEIASISERRLYLLLGGDTVGERKVPRLLVKEGGLNSGQMLLQYTAAALVSGYVLLSAGWLIMKADEALREWAYGIAYTALIAVATFIVIFSLWPPFLHPEIAARWFQPANMVMLSPVPLATAASVFALWMALNRRNRYTPFLLGVALAYGASQVASLAEGRG